MSSSKPPSNTGSHGGARYVPCYAGKRNWLRWTKTQLFEIYACARQTSLKFLLSLLNERNLIFMYSVCVLFVHRLFYISFNYHRYRVRCQHCCCCGHRHCNFCAHVITVVASATEIFAVVIEWNLICMCSVCVQIILYSLPSPASTLPTNIVAACRCCGHRHCKCCANVITGLFMNFTLAHMYSVLCAGWCMCDVIEIYVSAR